MANRYASQQRDRSSSRALLDAVVACTPMTSLVAGLALASAGYLLDQPAVAAGGALTACVGLYVERRQARTLRRRRRAERMRSRHEVTELRRTIAQLRQDVDAFQRALLDTEAALAARCLPLLRPVPTPGAPVLAQQTASPLPAVPVSSEPAASRLPAAQLAPPLGDGQLVVVPLERAEAEGWVQTTARDATGEVPLPPQRPSPFVAAGSGSLPILQLLSATTDACDVGVSRADLSPPDISDVDISDVDMSEVDISDGDVWATPASDAYLLAAVVAEPARQIA